MLVLWRIQMVQAYRALVMPGLVPGIHGNRYSCVPQLVDGRDMPGHDRYQ